VLVKEGLMSNVYVRQVFDLAFEQGKQYAMQVTARDRNGLVGISNQGRSEISVFTVGTVDTPVIPYGGTAPSGPIIDPGVSPASSQTRSPASCTTSGMRRATTVPQRVPAAAAAP
jgi:hypothetical protein